jgi:hypothetical protein
VLARHSTTYLSHAPALFALVTLQIRSRVFVRASRDHDPPIYVSCVAGMTGVCYHDHFLLVVMRSNLFCLGWPQASIFPVSTPT